MNYLENKIKGRLREIIDYKIDELEVQKKSIPLEEILEKLDGAAEPRDFFKALEGEGIKLIAEVKKASPSAGDINTEVDIVEQAKKYESAGANAISVLTDKKFFKGSLDYLKKIKQAVSIPVLRKDFIFDPYQVHQSKLAGADGKRFGRIGRVNSRAWNEMFAGVA
jgi:indole-3-glycerol phosphate synthase